MALGISDELADKTGTGKRAQGNDVHVMVAVLPADTTTLLTVANKPAAVAAMLTHSAFVAGVLSLTGATAGNVANMAKGDRVIVEGLSKFPLGLFADISSIAANVIKVANARNVFGVAVDAATAAVNVAEAATIQHFKFVALPRETSSSITFETRTSSVQEKSPYAGDQPVAGLDQEDIIARTWSVNVTLNEAVEENNILDQMLEYGLTSKDASIWLRMVKNESFRGWSGCASASPDSSPGDASSEGVIGTTFTLRGSSYLFMSGNI